MDYICLRVEIYYFFLHRICYQCTYVDFFLLDKVTLVCMWSRPPVNTVPHLFVPSAAQGGKQTHMVPFFRVFKIFRFLGIHLFRGVFIKRLLLLKKNVLQQYMLRFKKVKFPAWNVNLIWPSADSLLFRELKWSRRKCGCDIGV